MCVVNTHLPGWWVWCTHCRGTTSHTWCSLSHQHCSRSLRHSALHGTLWDMTWNSHFKYNELEGRYQKQWKVSTSATVCALVLLFCLWSPLHGELFSFLFYFSSISIWPKDIIFIFGAHTCATWTLFIITNSTKTLRTAKHISSYLCAYVRFEKRLDKN